MCIYFEEEAKNLNKLGFEFFQVFFGGCFFFFFFICNEKKFSKKIKMLCAFINCFKIILRSDQVKVNNIVPRQRLFLSIVSELLMYCVSP